MNDEHLDLCPCFDCGKDFALKVGDVLVPLSSYRSRKCGNIRIIALIRSVSNIVAYQYSTPTRVHCTLAEVLCGKVVSKAHVIQGQADDEHFNSWTEENVLNNYKKL